MGNGWEGYIMVRDKCESWKRWGMVGWAFHKHPRGFSLDASFLEPYFLFVADNRLNICLKVMLLDFVHINTK